MKNSKRSFIAVLMLVLFSLAFSVNARDYYQIKVYTIKDKEHDVYIHDFIDFGLSWLLESFWPGRCSLEEIQYRIEQGPPE